MRESGDSEPLCWATADGRDRERKKRGTGRGCLRLRNRTRPRPVGPRGPEQGNASSGPLREKHPRPLKTVAQGGKQPGRRDLGTWTGQAGAGVGHGAQRGVDSRGVGSSRTAPRREDSSFPHAPLSRTGAASTASEHGVALAQLPGGAAATHGHPAWPPARPPHTVILCSHPTGPFCTAPPARPPVHPPTWPPARATPAGLAPKPGRVDTAPRPTREPLTSDCAVIGPRSVDPSRAVPALASSGLLESSAS